MEKLLTNKEAAKMLGYSAHALIMSRKSGELGGVKAPKHTKVVFIDMLLWLRYLQFVPPVHSILIIYDYFRWIFDYRSGDSFG